MTMGHAAEVPRPLTMSVAQWTVHGGLPTGVKVNSYEIVKEKKNALCVH